MLPNFIAQLFLHMDEASGLTWTETDFLKKHVHTNYFHNYILIINIQISKH